MQNNPIKNVDEGDAANKSYVDSKSVPKQWIETTFLNRKQWIETNFLTMAIMRRLWQEI